MGETTTRQDARAVVRERFIVAGAILGLTVLSYFQFPGHTYLGSDSQIYVPMLEHIADPSVLSKDLVAARPHLAFTLYDEIALGLRRVTRGSFESVLAAQQLTFRGLEILGVYLLALALPIARRLALLVAALFTLGATIVGPAVLTFEYDPVPRGFALGLIFLAIGLAAQNQLILSDLAAALAFLYHPPTALPFYAVYLPMAVWRRDYRRWWAAIAAALLLFLASRFQPGAIENQAFLDHVSPELENLQRMRTSYVWVSTWPVDVIYQYIVLWLLSLIAFLRARPKAAGLFLLGLPAIGIASVPLSYVLLEKLKWGLIPQFQPARAVLFITAFTMVLAAVAAIRSAENQRWIEAGIWFVIVLSIPVSPRIFSMTPRCLSVVFALSAALCASIYFQRASWTPVATALLAFFLLPGLGLVRNYPKPNLRGIQDLAGFARTATPKAGTFLFGDAGTSADPSIFRALSERAVYVDWKSGGQMNFSETSALEWWQRWREVNMLQFDPAEVPRVKHLGIDYLVLKARNRLPDWQPVFENDEFVAYSLTH